MTALMIEIKPREIKYIFSYDTDYNLLRDNFALFNHFTDEELQNNNDCFVIDNKILYDLLNYTINNENIYDILKFAEYYQYNKFDELIIDVQTLIFREELIIDKNILKNNNLYDTIYEGDCIKNGKMTCSSKLYFENLGEYLQLCMNLQHASCYNYIKQNYKLANIIMWDGYSTTNIINLCIKYNNISLIKALLNDGYKFTQSSYELSKEYPNITELINEYKI